MSIESAKILRNGKVLSNSLPETSSIDVNNIPNFNMESSNNFSEEINQSGRNSPTNEDHTQTANEERFNRLQDEMSILKSLMEKIISQNEERNKQNGGSFATSSYAVGTSNMVTGVNRTHRNQRHHFQDEEDEDDYEDAPSNTTESALLNAIQDLPRKLQKTNTNFFKLTCQISADQKTNTTSSNTYYSIISAPSPIKSRKKIKSTSSRAYFETRPSIFGKLSLQAQQRHCKMSSNYSEKNLQKKT